MGAHGGLRLVNMHRCAPQLAGHHNTKFARRHNVRAARVAREVSGVGLEVSRRIPTACFGLGHDFFEIRVRDRGGVCCFLELGLATATDAHARPAPVLIRRRPEC